MEETQNNHSFEVFDYRLTAIESSIKELKELLVTVPIVINKLDSFYSEVKEDIEKLNRKIDIANENIENRFNQNLTNEISRLETKIQNNVETLKLEINNKIDQVEKRIDNVEVNQDLFAKDVSSIKSDVVALKAAPDKKSASKWNYIVENIFKTVVGIGIAYLIMRLGLGE